MKTVNISTPSGDLIYRVGEGNALVFFIGPCVIESRDHALRHAEHIAKIRDSLKVSIVYKSSFDKANRTSGESFRGLGLDESMLVLDEIRSTFNLPVISDVHSPEQVPSLTQVLDVLQVPAFLCRQTDLLLSVGSSQKPVLIKKGQFLHPDDMRFAAEKVVSAGGEGRVIFCERGSCFGYRDLVVDFRSFGKMREQGSPVVFDATHSVQSMGGLGGRSGGSREFVFPLARAAVAYGVDGVFLEVHEDPENAPSDGPNMLRLEFLERVIGRLLQYHVLRLEEENDT